MINHEPGRVYITLSALVNGEVISSTRIVPFGHVVSKTNALEIEAVDESKRFWEAIVMMGALEGRMKW